MNKESVFHLVITLKAPYALLQILGRRISFGRTTTICIDRLLCSSLVSFELFNLWTIHVLHDLISLPLFETEAKTFVRVVFVIGLIFVVFDLDEVGILGRRVEGERD